MASLYRNSSANSDANDEIKEKTGSEMIETVAEPRRRVEVQESAWASAKNNPKVIFYSVGACASSMLWGFDIGMNTILPQVITAF
jgi:SP family general alpha glucoside:H+ symporter-like MFS transporter